MNINHFSLARFFFFFCSHLKIINDNEYWIILSRYFRCSPLPADTLGTAQKPRCYPADRQRCTTGDCGLFPIPAREPPPLTHTHTPPYRTHTHTRTHTDSRIPTHGVVQSVSEYSCSFFGEFAQILRCNCNYAFSFVFAAILSVGHQRTWFEM